MSSGTPDATAALSSLAQTLHYPREGYLEQVARTGELLAARPAAAAAWAPFAARVEGLKVDELEELFTRTFDLDPVCCLETGWHLWGEQYERGRFLARCRDLLERVGIDEGGELPDHLMSLLAALDRLAAEEAQLLASRFIRPAVERMKASLAKRESPYLGVLAAAAELLGEIAPATATGVADAPYAGSPRLPVTGRTRAAGLNPAATDQPPATDPVGPSTSEASR